MSTAKLYLTIFLSWTVSSEFNIAQKYFGLSLENIGERQLQLNFMGPAKPQALHTKLKLDDYVWHYHG